MDEKNLLFSISKAKGDFVVQPFKGSGKGGQKRNKTMSCCRITHPKSGAAAECQEERSYEQNKKIAFTRLCDTPAFKAYFKTECSKAMGNYIDVESMVDKSMVSSNIKVEIQVDGKWVEVDENFNPIEG